MINSGYKSNITMDEKVMITIVRVAERFKKEFSNYLRDYEITFPQYNVLRVLDASKNGQNTMKNVNQIMLVSSANMTGITKRLEKIGFIKRKNAPEDDRLKYLKITPKGRQVLKRIAGQKDDFIGQYLVNYTDADKKEFVAFLRTILNRAL